MNIPEMAKRVQEINTENKIDSDPFPKFDQAPPPASVGEAIAAADEQAEAEQPPAEEQAEEEAPAEEEQEAEEQADEEVGDDAAAAHDEAPTEEDDIAWVKANKGFEVSDPVVAKTLRNQEEMIRRQGTEVGEARKAIERERQEREAFQAQVEQQLQEEFEPDEEWEEWADEGLLTDVHATLQTAFDHGGQGALNYVVSRWHLIDPVMATAFQIQMSKTEPSPGQQEERADPWTAVGSRHPDLFDYRDSMTALLEENPEIRERMNRLVSVDPEAALENLYLQARVGQTDRQRSDALAKANAARAAKDDASARDATVASATASASHGEGRPLTEAEQVRANIRAELGLAIPE